MMPESHQLEDERSNVVRKGASREYFRTLGFSPRVLETVRNQDLQYYFSEKGMGKRRTFRL